MFIFLMRHQHRREKGGKASGFGKKNNEKGSGAGGIQPRTLQYVHIVSVPFSSTYTRCYQ